MARARPAGKITPKRALVEQIERAFANVPYPGDNGICAGLTDAERRLGTEEAEVEAAFRGRFWRDVPAEVIEHHYASLSLFSPQAYHFYLPAYMLAALGVLRRPPDHPHVGYAIKDAVIWSLTPPKSQDSATEWFLGRVTGFSSEQKAAIRAFLHWMDKESGGIEMASDPSKTKRLNDAARALRRYWEAAK